MPDNVWKQAEQLLNDLPMQMDRCNCEQCLAPPDSKQIVIGLMRKAMPQMKYLPRIYNDDLPEAWHDGKARYYRRGGKKYWFQLIDTLRGIIKYNTTFSEEARKQLTLCADCGLYTVTENMKKFKCRLDEHSQPKNHLLCETCYGRYTVCEDCGEVIQIRNAVRYRPDYDYHKWVDKRMQNHYICQACYAPKYWACSYCGMPVQVDKIHNVSFEAGFGEDMQIIALRQCGAIAAFGRDDELVDMEIEDEQLEEMDIEFVERPRYGYCDYCFEHNIHECMKCGSRRTKNKLRRAIYRGEEGWLCVDCQVDAQVIKRYDYSTKPKFLRAPNEPTRLDVLHYGVEVEMEYVGEWHGIGKDRYREHRYSLEQKGEYILDWWGDDSIYIKHDGSLDHGYEIVSHPFTWSYYLANREKWTDFLIWLTANGFSADYYSTDKDRYTCGFHVHMSKAAFSHMHLYKFVNFVYKKSTRALINGVAERYSEKFACFNLADYQNAIQTAKEKKNASNVRYSAINLMGGHAHEHGNAPAECQTCEIRVFKGTLSPFIFHKNMEFLQSLFEFSAMYSPKDMVVKKYLDYLLLKPNNWRCLLNFIKYSTELNNAYKYMGAMLKGV